jgi:HEAT repeat protein
MTVLDKLATALNRRDEVPNQELAREIVRTNNRAAVKELVENLTNNDKNIQSDCIKVLYEIGERHPALLAPYYREFGKLLDSTNNRLVWGAMTALDSIAGQKPKGVYGLLAKILDVADSGSVITRDHAVGILVKLGSLKQYAEECLPLLLEQLLACPNNQFPMYAEMSLALANEKSRAALQKVITRRLDGLEKESQRKRIAKVLKRLTKVA